MNSLSSNGCPGEKTGELYALQPDERQCKMAVWSSLPVERGRSIWPVLRPFKKQAHFNLCCPAMDESSSILFELTDTPAGMEIHRLSLGRWSSEDNECCRHINHFLRLSIRPEGAKRHESDPEPDIVEQK